MSGRNSEGENPVLEEVKEGFTRALFFQLALLGKKKKNVERYKERENVVPPKMV